MASNILDKAADNIRILTAAMVEKAKSGHPGGAMGGADFINVLYSKYLITDLEDRSWFSRDRFFLDPGHMSPMLYSVLTLMGYYSIEDLKQFRQWGSVTPGHPELNPERGIENTSGPLGLGHVMAVGCALAERFIVERFGEVWAHKTYAFISDGGIQEEVSQGAGRIAGYLGLSNLIMFFDSNKVQLSTDCNEVSTEDTAAKYRAWNWNVIEVDGSDCKQMSEALENAIAEKERPTLIIGNTIMGKGCVDADGNNFEGKYSTHGCPLSKSGASYEKTIQNLGGDIENPWVIWDDVAKLYEERKMQLKAIVAERKKAQEEWKQANPELWNTLKGYIEGRVPEIDYAAIPHKPNVATRTASADIMAVLGEKVGNMIMSSADLANSDKTEAFMKKVGAFTPENFKAGFLHAGVAELTMAAIMNGIVLHGGMFAGCGTFFVFSDYMKPAIRMSALMKLPVKFIWTHDSFRVGEDGPTHEPVEQEAQIRLLEEIKNPTGENSMLVLRPADSAETTVAWKMAMENTKTPTGLILTRQDVKDIPSQSGDRYADAQMVQKGGYVIYKDENPQIVLVGNGSDVSTLYDAAQILKKDNGLRVMIASVPSTGLFNRQSEEYRNSVIPSQLPQFGLTSGLSSVLRSVVHGAKSKIYGFDRFGASAPYKVLEEKFGFTPENIANKIREFLGL